MRILGNEGPRKSWEVLGSPRKSYKVLGSPTKEDINYFGIPIEISIICSSPVFDTGGGAGGALKWLAAPPWSKGLHMTSEGSTGTRRS